MGPRAELLCRRAGEELLCRRAGEELYYCILRRTVGALTGRVDDEDVAADRAAGGLDRGDEGHLMGACCEVIPGHCRWW